MRKRRLDLAGAESFDGKIDHDFPFASVAQTTYSALSFDRRSLPKG
jgi:hypothetical protein